jgi:hypothetical protein
MWAIGGLLVVVAVAAAKMGYPFSMERIYRIH